MVDEPVGPVEATSFYINCLNAVLDKFYNLLSPMQVQQRISAIAEASLDPTIPHGTIVSVINYR